MHSDELNAMFQCSLRSRLKKEGVSIFTGDLVELEEEEPSFLPQSPGTAVIAARRERKNLLTRPFIANLDQVFIVQSMHQPEWNALLCDRYLVALQLELDHFRSFICVNKCDLAQEESLSALRNIYEPLGYTVLFISAKTGAGMDELALALSAKSSAFIGPSGVGKSSMINSLIPELNLKVDINEDLLVGRHTTTYSELYKLPLAQAPDRRQPAGWIADTPGFNIGEIEYPQPADVAWQFPELVALAPDCKFSNCLHIGEAGCNVETRMAELAPSRYASYCAIVADARNEARLRAETSSKIDSGTRKQVGGPANARVLPRLNERFRAKSRRKLKQGLTDYRKSGSEFFLEEDEESDSDEGTEQDSQS